MKSSTPDQATDQARRRFIGGIAAAAGVALAPGVFLHQVAAARAPDQPVSDAVRWGLLIDTRRCATGCDACVSACNNEHGIQSFDRPATDAQWLRKVTLKDQDSGRVVNLPMMCQHCEHPPCVDVCPTGASFKRDDGIVLVDKHICIGCRYCMMACPFQARSFIHETLTEQKPWAPRGKGTVESCTLCVHRIDKDGAEARTACQQACDEAGHGAITFGDMNDADSPISRRLREVGGQRMRPDLALNPGVRYVGV